MAVGKSKKVGKGGKKGKKSRVDPFSRKEWFDIKAPSMFEIRNVGKTFVNRTTGTSMYFLVVVYFFLLFLIISLFFIYSFIHFNPSLISFPYGYTNFYQGVQKRVWEDVYLKFLLQTYKRMKSMLSERLNSVLTMFRAIAVSPTSTEWTLPLINSALS